MARVVILVNSSVVADQRVNRTAVTLRDAGHAVTIVGRRRHGEASYDEGSIKVKLLNMPIHSGMASYAFFNLLAFTYLLFKDFDLLHANDLDTLMAGRSVCLIKGKPIIYDSHELFTELPELVNRKVKRRIWQTIERYLTKGLQFCSTVSQGVANELARRYAIRCEVIRNLPFRVECSIGEGLPSSKKIIIYQGALNQGRGIEKAIEAMCWVENATLWIIGSGYLERELHELSHRLKLSDRVTFFGQLKPSLLRDKTLMASIGISLEADMGLNYRYALPNKLFDYIQAGLPVLVSNLPEMEAIANEYNVGETIESECTPQQLAAKLNHMLTSSIKMKQWQENSLIASKTLCWENEKGILIDLVQRALTRNPVEY